MYIGAHESASGGVHKAVERAVESGCESVQVFVKNNNRWAQRDWRPDEIQAFRDAYASSGLHGIQAHAGYLINLATDREDVLEKSLDALADELTRCAQFGIPYLVMHPGSHVGQGEEVGLRLIAERAAQVYAREVDGQWQGVTLLYELTAGQGSNLGYTLEQLARLFELAHDASRFGICFDTCHAHAAGYDLTTESSYEAFWRAFDATIGLHRLKAFHLNDSKGGLGSKLDRHEHIGEGAIGLETFRMLMNDARFTHTIASLETPPIDKNDSGYAKNLQVLRDLRS